MTFAQWCKTQGGNLAKFGRDIGVSYATLMRASAGGGVRDHEKCKRISEATGGAVSVDEVNAGDAKARAESVKRKRRWLERQVARAGAEGAERGA